MVKNLFICMWHDAHLLHKTHSSNNLCFPLPGIKGHCCTVSEQPNGELLHSKLTRYLGILGSGLPGNWRNLITGTLNTCTHTHTIMNQIWCKNDAEFESTVTGFSLRWWYLTCNSLGLSVKLCLLRAEVSNKDNIRVSLSRKMKWAT